MERIVVVGAGQAAGWAVSTLRQEGFTGEIHVVSDENQIFMSVHHYQSKCCRKKLLTTV